MNTRKALKATLATSAFSATAFLSLAISAPGAFASSLYRTTAHLPLAERAAPSTSAAVLGWLSYDSTIDIACQTTGTDVYGSSIWDKLTGGQYVSDYWVDTPVYGNFSPGLPRCSSTPVPAPVTPPAPTGRAVGATTSGDQGYPGQCTWWADDQFHAYSGLWPNFTGNNNGNAEYWAANAAARGWTVTSVPEVGSVAVFPAWTNGSGGDGHVAWVTSVSGQSITVTEMNFTYGAYNTDTRTLVPAGTVRFILAP